MKLTNAQKELLNEIKNKYYRLKSEYEELEIKDVNYYWVDYIKEDLIEIKANTKSLQVLENFGYIKIVSHIDYGHKNWDLIKVLF